MKKVLVSLLILAATSPIIANNGGGGDEKEKKQEIQVTQLELKQRLGGFIANSDALVGHQKHCEQGKTEPISPRHPQ